MFIFLSFDLTNVILGLLLGAFFIHFPLLSIGIFLFIAVSVAFIYVWQKFAAFCDRTLAKIPRRPAKIHKPITYSAWEATACFAAIHLAISATLLVQILH